MLTRLKVSGFKNLLDVDVRFGAFTCLAGPNGAGKSNLFDAIAFLAALADAPLMEAAMTVRGVERPADIDTLFYCNGGRIDEQMTFEVEMITQQAGVDDLGQPARAGVTFVRYQLTLGRGSGVGPPLMIISEDLDRIPLSEARSRLLFPHRVAWRRSVLWGRRSSPSVREHSRGSGMPAVYHHHPATSRNAAGSAEYTNS